MAPVVVVVACVSSMFQRLGLRGRQRTNRGMATPDLSSPHGLVHLCGVRHYFLNASFTLPAASLMFSTPSLSEASAWSPLPLPSSSWSSVALPADSLILPLTSVTLLAALPS